MYNMSYKYTVVLILNFRSQEASPDKTVNLSKVAKVERDDDMWEATLKPSGLFFSYCLTV